MKYTRNSLFNQKLTQLICDFFSSISLHENIKPVLDLLLLYYSCKTQWCCVGYLITISHRPKPRTINSSYYGISHRTVHGIECVNVLARCCLNVEIGITPLYFPNIQKYILICYCARLLQIFIQWNTKWSKIPWSRYVFLYLFQFY